MRQSMDRQDTVGGTGKLVVALGAALGAWQILTAPDPGKVAVQVLMAAGVGVIVATLLFARELTALLRGPLYAVVLLILVAWLVLSFGVTQWQWSLLPPS